MIEPIKVEINIDHTIESMNVDTLKYVQTKIQEVLLQTFENEIAGKLLSSEKDLFYSRQHEKLIEVLCSSWASDNTRNKYRKWLLKYNQ
jgi:tRNA(His) 5'-end guanylyltransferase